MDNPYLIGAMYGQNKSSANASSQQSQDSMAGMHPARLLAMKTEGPLEEEPTEPISFQPTGANATGVVWTPSSPGIQERNWLTAHDAQVPKPEPTELWESNQYVGAAAFPAQARQSEMIQQEYAHQAMSLTDNQAIAPLDPRLRNRQEKRKRKRARQSKGSGSLAVVRFHPRRGHDLHHSRPFDFSPETPPNAESQRTADMNLHSQSEKRIQELEDEVCDLHRTIVMKDREIRKLKLEMETLRQTSAETGAESSRMRARYNADPLNY